MVQAFADLDWIDHSGVYGNDGGAPHWRELDSLDQVEVMTAADLSARTTRYLISKKLSRTARVLY